MSERYTRLVSIDEKRWSEDCPLLFLKGALLKDTRTERNILQLKFQSLSRKRIKAFEVWYEAYSLGDEKLESKKFSYLDLSLAINDVVGEDVPIYMDKAESRSFKLSVAAVYYEDGSRWTGNAELQKIENQILMQDGLDYNLAQQFEREYKKKSDRKVESMYYLPVFKESYWLCSCGALNPDKENRCRKCKVTKEDLIVIKNEEFLRNNLLDYVQKEKESNEREEQESKALEQRAEGEKQKRHIKYIKYTKAMSVIAGAVAVVILFITLANKVIIPNQKYSSANSAFDSGDYETAINMYEELGNYKESKNKLLESKYCFAKKFMEAKKYSESIEEFKKIEDYKDAKDLIVSCDRSIRYDEAISLAKSGRYEAALIKIKSLPNDFLDKEKLELEYVQIQSKTFYDVKDYESTYKLLRQYDIKNDLFMESCYQVALSYKKSKKYENAITCFQEIKNYKKSRSHIINCEKTISYNNAVDLMEQGELNKATKLFSKVGKGFKKVNQFLALCTKYKRYVGIWKCYKHSIIQDGDIYNGDYSASDENMICKVCISKKGKVNLYFDGEKAKLSGNIATWHYVGKNINKFNLSTGYRTLQFYNSDGSKSDLYTYQYKVK